MKIALIVGSLLLLMLWFFLGKLFFLNRKEAKDQKSRKIMEQLIVLALVVGTLSLILSFLI